MQQMTYIPAKNKITNDHGVDSYKRSLLASAWAWIVCPVVFLFSYVPVLNLIARWVLIVFLLWFAGMVINRKRELLFFSPFTWYLIWTLYALLVSGLAFDLQSATLRWITVFSTGLLGLAVYNSIIWSGSYKSWGWAFVVSAVVAYVTNYLPIQDYLISNYETEVGGRIIGTLGNANSFGRAMVQGFVIGVGLLLFHYRGIQALFSVLAMEIMALAVLDSGSRTAILGLGLSLVALFHCVRLRHFFSPVTFTVLTASASSLVAIFLYYPERWRVALDRMNIFLSHIGLVPRIYSSEHSIEKRMELARIAWDTLWDYPLGIGLNNFREITGTYAHSNYLEVLVSSGIIGFVIYYSGFIILGRKAMNSARSIANYGVSRFLIWSLLVSMAMDITNVSYYSKVFWIFIGVVGGMYVLAVSKNAKLVGNMDD